MEQTINANHAVATFAVSIFGMATGLTYEALFAGFAGALCSLSFLGTMSGFARVWTIFTSTVFAGYTVTVSAATIEAVMRYFLPHLVDLSFAFFLGPYLTGLAAQGLIPLVRDGLMRLAGNAANGATK